MVFQKARNEKEVYKGMIRDQIFKWIGYKRLKIKDLAVWSGLSASLLYKYKRGGTNLSEESIERLLDAMGVDVLLMDKNE